MEDKELIDSIFKETGIRVSRIEEIEDHYDFESLVREVPPYFEGHPNLQSVVKVLSHPMNTIVFTPEGPVMKIHNALDFVCVDGSLLRYSPIGDRDLELTRVQVAKGGRGKGFGTKFMQVTFDSFERVLGYVPEIRLECTGAVGFGETLEETSVLSQINFFKKSGFHLNRFDEEASYATMTRPASDFGWDLTPSSLPPYATSSFPAHLLIQGVNPEDLPF